MNFNKKILVLAMAGALPFMSAHAQSADDLKKEIELLKAQLKMLSEKVEAMSAKPAAVEPQEFNRLVQKMDLVEEEADKAGLKGMTFKGAIDVTFQTDQLSAATGFDKAKGNGGNGAAMFEISKAPDDGLGWTLRLVPLSASGSIVHEATASVAVGSNGTKLNVGLTPDYSGYEYSMGNLNPLVSNNLLYTHSAATNYMGAGMSYEIGDWTAKWIVGQVDGVATRKAPGFAYRADYSISEYSGVGFSGVHVRTNDPASGANTDLMEIDAYRTRGDLTLQGQFSVGRLIQGALDGSGSDARWWGLSGLVGYKLSPRLQAIARLDYINNRANGGGMYYNPADANGTTVFGPELDEFGVAADPSRGANRYALSAGLNYTVNANTQWKTELRFDRSSGYNFLNSAGEYKQNNTTVGTSLVMSF
jgi:Putative beta-barrel porin-2, OmpL-like. bbp2